MNLPALAAILGLSAFAATPDAPPRPMAPYWTKRYPVSMYKEFWTGELALKDFSRDLPRALDKVKKNHGTLTQALETFAGSAKNKIQQVSFSISRQGAKALVADFRKLGDMADPTTRPRTSTRKYASTFW